MSARLPRMESSQRAQKIEYFLLLLGTQVAKVLFNVGRFAAMALVSLDGSDQVGSAAVVQEEDALAQPPERRGAELDRRPRYLGKRCQPNHCPCDEFRRQSRR